MNPELSCFLLSLCPELVILQLFIIFFFVFLTPVIFCGRIQQMNFFVSAKVKMSLGTFETHRKETEVLYFVYRWILNIKLGLVNQYVVYLCKYNLTLTRRQRYGQILSLDFSCPLKRTVFESEVQGKLWASRNSSECLQANFLKGNWRENSCIF